MKKIISLLCLTFFAAGCLKPASAVELPIGPGPYAASKPVVAPEPPKDIYYRSRLAAMPPPPLSAESQTDVYYHIGPLNLTIPWDNINVVYLYDLNGKRNLIGGEGVVMSLWRLQGTVGAVTSIDGHGAPYVGGNLWLPNPIPQIAVLNYIQPGIFGGYDWNRSAAIWGFKAAVSIF